MPSYAIAAFDASYDRVSAATLTALRNLRVNITGSEEKPQCLQVQVTKSMNLFSWGEVGRVLVEKSAAPPWRTGVVETAEAAQVDGTEDRDSRIAMGLMGGVVGLAFALGTEKDLGKASVWRYLVRDGGTPVRLQSFAVFRPGDCVRYALGGNPADTPMEKLPPESCPAN